MNYSDQFKKELEKAREDAGAGKAKRQLKPLGDAEKALERLHAMVEELAGSGAPIVTRAVNKDDHAIYSLILAIGDADYPVTIINSTIKVHWRGKDSTPMIYDSLAASRLAALAKAMIERAVSETLSNEKHIQPASARVIRIS
jgi:hypothetical protein